MMQRYTREYEDMVYDDEGDFVLYDEAQAVIAAKDAEIQKANYLLARREKLIKKLGKKLQSAESANAALVALLNRVPNRLRKLADYLDADSKATGFLPTSALAAENRERADEIDAALKEAGVRE